MKQFVVLLALAIASANANIVPRPGFPEGRIINGQEAKRGEASFIVSLQSLSGSHFCGGSLLSPHWILTAAHCCFHAKHLAVAGAHNYQDKETTQIRQVTSENHYVHEKYSGGVGPNDIALIYVPIAFDLRDGSAPVSAIALPVTEVNDNTKGKLYGWGRNSTGSIEILLQSLVVDIIKYANCKAALPSNAPIHKSNICTYTAGKSDGACNGDSGGPLVTYAADGSAVLVGCVSWGYTPCTSTYPSVFTYIKYHISWIHDIISKNPKP